MVNEKFSIIFQGQILPKTVESMCLATKHSDDVILSTWTNCLTEHQKREIHSYGIRIVETDDPGTISRYQRKSIVKGFNFFRQLCGTLAGAKVARYDDVIRTRTDVTMDFSKAYRYFSSSHKELACASVTTVCPKRLFVKPRWFHGSDWVLISSRERILKRFLPIIGSVSERSLLDNFPDLSTEQFWTLALMLDQFTIDQVHRCVDHSLEMHHKFKSQFLNLPSQEIELLSSKYKNRAIRWATYNTFDYSDDGFLGNIRFLPYFIAASVFR